MKKIVEQVEGEGFEALLGERVTVMCANYTYTGKLMGVNDTCILLEDASIIYDTDSTGAPTATGGVPSTTWYVSTGFIESFGRAK